MRAVDSRELPAGPGVLVFIPEPGNVIDEVFRTRLRLSNPELRTRDWLLMNRKTEREGQLLAYIDKESFLLFCWQGPS